MPRPQLFPVKKVIGFDQEMIDAIHSYCRDHSAIPNISEAIRELLQISLREKGYINSIEHAAPGASSGSGRKEVGKFDSGTASGLPRFGT